MVQVKETKPKLPTRPVRFAFSKTGVLQYISHLDLQRTMAHAIIRAGIPVWYTEGYNPKPRLQFSTPLSIGTESRYELMDLRIVLPDENAPLPDLSAMRDALDATLPAELHVFDAYEPNSKFADVAFSAYTVRIREEELDDTKVENCRRVLTSSPLIVLKRTKSGEKDTDISPMIREISFSREENELVLSMVLNASPASFLNPEYAITALLNAGVLCDVPKTEREYSIMRENLFDCHMQQFR